MFLQIKKKKVVFDFQRFELKQYLAIYDLFYCRKKKWVLLYWQCAKFANNIY